VKRNSGVFATPTPQWARNVHVVGIAGSGLRGIGLLLNQRGAKVTGSEMAESPVLDRLRSRNIDCRVGHDKTNVSRAVNLVVVSAAVDSTNPEVQAAQARSIPVWKYAECLGKLMAEKTGIAVAGTHGKTTTTAMVSHVLRSAGLDPSFLIGGDYPALGGGAHWGRGDHFVAEACEYDRSFLNLAPRVAVVTNVDEDHLDYFDSVGEIHKAFGEFVGLLPSDGLLVLNQDDPNSRFLRDLSHSQVISFSLESKSGADWWAEGLDHRGAGYSFVAVNRSEERIPVQLGVPGLHNVRNALSAIAICRSLGVSLRDICEGIEAFSGVRRRFDILCRGPVTVVDDYAHHPAELDAVLMAARARYPGRRIIAVFQPHQHSRLKRFRTEFAEVLAKFSESVVLDVFRARDSEEDARSVRSECLVDSIRSLGGDACYASRFDDALRILSRTQREAVRGSRGGGSVVLFMGAGNVTDLAKFFATEVSKSRGGTESEVGRQNGRARQSEATRLLTA